MRPDREARSRPGPKRSIKPASDSSRTTSALGCKPLMAARRSRSRPSLSRNPMSRASSACSDRLSGMLSHDAVPGRLDALGPALRLALGRRGVARAGDDDAAVRARPEPRIFAVAPVEQVVAAFLARGGVVGDLVGRQAGPLRQLLRQLVEVVRQLAVRHLELAAGMELGKRRLRPRWSADRATGAGPRAPGPATAPPARLAASGRAGRRSGRRRSGRMFHVKHRSRSAPPRPCAGGPMPASRHR